MVNDELVAIGWDLESAELSKTIRGDDRVLLEGTVMED